MTTHMTTPSQPFFYKHFMAHDLRGSFHKTLSNTLPPSNEKFIPNEAFLSHSRQGVLRGMHFQAPPHDHAKCVSCISGLLFDVIIDIRLGLNFGKTYTFTLQPGDSVYIPKGFAHGFFTLEEAVTSYLVDSAHEPNFDMGIHWASLDVEWPTRDPIISPRDQAFPPLASFSTPFLDES